MKTHANEFAFNCSICRHGFDSKKAKSAHEKICDRKIFQCDLCQYNTLYKSHFDAHMRTHDRRVMNVPIDVNQTSCEKNVIGIQLTK